MGRVEFPRARGERRQVLLEPFELGLTERPEAARQRGDRARADAILAQAHQHGDLERIHSTSSK